MLEDNELTDESVDRIGQVLRDKKLQTEIAEHNFALGRQHFSYEVLEKKLEVLFSA
jgi:hypothetical protein